MFEQYRHEGVARRVSLYAAAHRAALLQERHLERDVRALARAADQAAHAERRQALDRMVQNATLMGANAVISMRFDSSELGGTMSEIVAYGTAVVISPDADAGQPIPE